MTKRLLSIALALAMVLSLGSFCVMAEGELPEEEIVTGPGEDGIGDDAVITLFDEPVSTTWGTSANVLPNGYTMTTDGQYGLTLIFKVEGTKPGTVIGKFHPIVTTNRVTDQDAVDEEGKPVLDAEGNPVKAVVTEKKSSEWNGNWVNDSYQTNSKELWGDGI